MLKFFNNKSKGFSVIEALIATSILAVGLIAILSIFPFVLRINKQAEMTSLASALARAKMEQLIVLPYDQLTPGNFEIRAHVTTDPNNPLYIFERSSIITLVDNNLSTSQTDTGLKKIQVIVYWPRSGSNDDSYITLTSLKARK